MAKTDWQMDDVVQPSDMNDIGQEINALAADVGDMSTVPTESKNAAGAITELYNTKETPAGAQAKADAVQANLNDHIGSGGSAHAAATSSTAGFMSASDKAKLDGIQPGAQVNTITSVAGKTGAVTLTKSDVGLGNVPNYPAATQAQAEAGADNASLMTPLRTKQHVDKRLLNNLMFRVNNGVPEYSTDGGVWKSVGGMDKYKTIISKEGNISSGSLTVLSASGRGYINNALIAIGGSSSSPKLKITVDGTVVFHGKIESSSKAIGIIQDENIKIHSENGFIARVGTLSGGPSLTTPKNHPFVDENQSGYVPLASPLFFDSSILIEITNVTNTTYYTVEGAME